MKARFIVSFRLASGRMEMLRAQTLAELVDLIRAYRRMQSDAAILVVGL